MGDQSLCSMSQIMVMCSMPVLARAAREIFSTLRCIRAIWIRANNALADGRKLNRIRPCQALLIIFALVLIGGCESDREELESSNSCVWCRLNDADFAGADLAGATLWMAFLERADLSEANLSGANINRAKLTAADLTDANLANVDARKAVLIRAELTGADLSKADLSEAILENASFR
ncbi:MAG: pentapeptide repeat-containing protein, partial [Proteobacteria bacterium]|nr:pentapeptide repeat-containing protein [Pseudomonadota bacterium]